MIDLFKSAEDVLITIKSCIEVFALTKNQTSDVTKDEDAENVMRIKSKNGKVWKVTVEEEEKN